MKDVDTTKKILFVVGFVFSVVAIFFGVFNLRYQSRLAHQLSQQEALAKLCSSSSAKASPLAIGGAGDMWLEVQKKVKDTVVQIYANTTEFNWIQPFKTPDQGSVAGSGFFINKEGFLVTNYHVVAQASNVEVTIPSLGQERFDVEIVGVAPERDVALLKLNKEAIARVTQRLGQIPFLNLGNSDFVLRSQEVLALGYPLAQTRLKSTQGIVSGRERLGSFGYIQITAPLNPGISGGPSVNVDGEVIGINTCGFQDAQNVGYIVPINEVKSALKDLFKIKLLRKPMLGCFFGPTTIDMVQYLGNPLPGGWYIAKVFEGSLLSRVGIKAGDMLYKINGIGVDIYGEMNVPWSEDKVSLLEYLNRLTIGDTIELLVYRQGTKKTFTFNLEYKNLPPIRIMYAEFEPEQKEYEVIGGMVVMAFNLNHLSIFIKNCPELIKYGRPENHYEPALILTHVLPNSQAEKTFLLKRGTIIQEINDEKVKSLDDFRKAIVKSRKTGFIKVKIDDHYIAVLPLEKVLKEEQLLADRYFYRVSKLMNELGSVKK